MQNNVVCRLPPMLNRDQGAEAGMCLCAVCFSFFFFFRYTTTSSKNLFLFSKHSLFIILFIFYLCRLNVNGWTFIAFRPCEHWSLYFSKSLLRLLGTVCSSFQLQFVLTMKIKINKRNCVRKYQSVCVYCCVLQLARRRSLLMRRPHLKVGRHLKFRYWQSSPSSLSYLAGWWLPRAKSSMYG